jgi:hypothetical protein
MEVVMGGAYSMGTWDRAAEAKAIAAEMHSSETKRERRMASPPTGNCGLCTERS